MVRGFFLLALLPARRRSPGARPRPSRARAGGRARAPHRRARRSIARFRPFDDEALASSDLGRAAAGLLGSLSLFFVPAGVGVVQYLGLLREQGVALAAALVVSTLATLVATVGVFILVKRLIGAREGA